MVVVAVFTAWPEATAQARGRRAVPDLQRDAQKWSQNTARTGVRIPLTVHVATDGGDPVSSQARVTQWVRRANRALAGAGIEVYVKGVRHLPRGWRAVTRAQQRRRLAAYAPSDGTIHVFVIEELDKPRRWRWRRRVRGLHWRYRGVRSDLRAREYVVVTDGAPNTTFAHELGHLFGLRHSTETNNIMCSCRQGRSLGFTPGQTMQMQQGAHAFVSRQPRSFGTAADVRRRRRRR